MHRYGASFWRGNEKRVTSVVAFPVGEHHQVVALGAHRPVPVNDLGHQQVLLLGLRHLLSRSVAASRSLNSRSLSPLAGRNCHWLR